MSNSPQETSVYAKIRREHEELRELLAEVERMLMERAESVTRVSHIFLALQKQVEGHFIEEERGGFFDEIIQQAPRLSRRTHDLCDEHKRLLAVVRTLTEHATRGNGSDWWQQLEGEFRRFRKDLMHHESKENELLQDTYGEDIGSPD